MVRSLQACSLRARLLQLIQFPNVRPASVRYGPRSEQGQHWCGIAVLSEWSFPNSEPVLATGRSRVY